MCKSRIEARIKMSSKMVNPNIVGPEETKSLNWQMPPLQRRVVIEKKNPSELTLDGKVQACGFVDSERYSDYIQTIPIVKLVKQGKGHEPCTSASRFLYQMEAFEYLRLCSVLHVLKDLVYTPVPDGKGFLPLASSRTMRAKGYTFNYRPPSEGEVQTYLLHTNTAVVADVPFVGKKAAQNGNYREALRTLGEHAGESLFYIAEALPTLAEVLTGEGFYVYNNRYLICVDCGATLQFRFKDIVEMDFYSVREIRRTHDNCVAACHCKRREDEAADELDLLEEVPQWDVEKICQEAWETLRDRHNNRRQDDVVKAFVKSAKQAPAIRPRGRGRPAAPIPRERERFLTLEPDETYELPAALAKMDFA